MHLDFDSAPRVHGAFDIGYMDDPDQPWHVLPVGEWIALLVPDPTVREDINAVAVHIPGRLLGHLSEANGARFQRLIYRAGGQVVVPLIVEDIYSPRLQTPWPDDLAAWIAAPANRGAKAEPILMAWLSADEENQMKLKRLLKDRPMMCITATIKPAMGAVDVTISDIDESINIGLVSGGAAQRTGLADLLQRGVTRYHLHIGRDGLGNVIANIKRYPWDV